MAAQQMDNLHLVLILGLAFAEENSITILKHTMVPVGVGLLFAP